jgi:ketosteroid isomerase-like protein
MSASEGQKVTAAARAARRIGGPVSAGLAEVTAWLERFAAAVRAADLDAGRALFAPEVVAFGTVGAMLVGREQLASGQWEKVWPVTSGFCFDMERAHCGVAGDLAWAAAPWTSRGLRDGAPFDRSGRGSYVLRREGGAWLAIHSHHSLDPVRADAP